jgi:hypothetical protein
MLIICVCREFYLTLIYYFRVQLTNGKQCSTFRAACRVLVDCCSPYLPRVKYSTGPKYTMTINRLQRIYSH